MQVERMRGKRIRIGRAQWTSLILTYEEAREIRRMLGDLLIGTDLDAQQHDITFGREDIVLLHAAIGLLGTRRAEDLEKRLDMLLGLWSKRKEE